MAASPIKINTHFDDHTTSASETTASSSPTPQSSLHEVFAAVTRGDLYTLRNLIPNRFSLRDVRLDDNWTLVLEAVHRRQADVLAFLISKGCDVNEGDDFGHTPLWWASSDR